MRAAILTIPQPIQKRPLMLADIPRPEMQAWACAPEGSRLRRVPHRSAHRRRRAAASPRAADSRPSDRRRRRRRSDRGAARRDARRRLLDGRHRRHLLVLPPRHGESLRRAHLHRLHAWTAAMPSMRWPAPISFSLCRRRSTTCMPRRCCAPASSASAACAWPASSRASASGLFGFGASAHLAIEVLHAWKCEVYVSTRGESHRRLAESLGAKWVGDETDRPPGRTRPRHHLRAQRRCGGGGAGQPAQGRSRGHQRHSSGSHSAIRLRQPAVGRAPDPQRRQHDPRRCPRLPASLPPRSGCIPR